MSQRRLAWTIWAVSVAFALVWVLVDTSVEGSERSIGEYLFTVGGVLLYATVGALITSRQRGNRVGLIFAWVALAAAVSGASGAYAQLAVERGLPFAGASTWLANLGVVAIVGPIAFLFLIFPTGSPPSRRWGWLLKVMVGAYAITLVLFAVTPGPHASGFRRHQQPGDQPDRPPHRMERGRGGHHGSLRIDPLHRCDRVGRFADPAVPRSGHRGAPADPLAGLARRVHGRVRRRVPPPGGDRSASGGQCGLGVGFRRLDRPPLRRDPRHLCGRDPQTRPLGSRRRRQEDRAVRVPRRRVHDRRGPR